MKWKQDRIIQRIIQYNWRFFRGRMITVECHYVFRPGGLRYIPGRSVGYPEIYDHPLPTKELQ